MTIFCSVFPAKCHFHSILLRVGVAGHAEVQQALRAGEGGALRGSLALLADVAVDVGDVELESLLLGKLGEGVHVAADLVLLLLVFVSALADPLFYWNWFFDILAEFAPH